MSVLFVYDSTVTPTRGGIGKITYTLSNLFNDNNIDTYFLGLKKDKKGFSNQYYLPQENLLSEENFIFLRKLIIEKNINLIINQESMNSKIVDFLFQIQSNNVKIISCLHNCTLTPILNYAYQKEFILNRTNKTWVFYILKNKIIKCLLKYLYIFKYRRQYRQLLSKSNYVILLSEGLKEEFLLTIGKKGSEKIKIIPNCISPIERISNIEKNNIILWVGSLDICVKRPDIILKAWSYLCNKYPNWELKILGDGPDMQILKEYKKELNLINCSFEGRVNPYPYYAESRILCVTSTHESFSLVTIEGLFFENVPIIINSFPGASSLLSYNNGVLVDSFDSKIFADKLEELIINEDKLEMYKQNTLLSIEKFFPQKVYDIYWKQLLQEHILS